MKKAPAAAPRSTETSDGVRGRIINAAFEAFMEHGFSRASTLDIATRARVSKRELYSHFKNKEALFAAGIANRTNRMRLALQVPDPATPAELKEALASMGRALLTSVTEPHVLAVHRLAIAESAASPEVAATLDRLGRGQNRRVIVDTLSSAQKKGLVGDGNAEEMADEFVALLWSDTLLRLLLRVIERPGPRDVDRRARRATEAFLALYGRSRT